MSRSSNTPATPVSNPASAQGVDNGKPAQQDVQREIKRIQAAATFTGGDSEDLISYAKEIVRLRASPAPSRDAAVPASGGVEAGREAAKAAWRSWNGTYDPSSDMTFEGAAQRGFLAGWGASLSPAPTSGSEAGDGTVWFGFDEGTGEFTGEYSTVKPDDTRGMVPFVRALAKPASEPAGGGVREQAVDAMQAARFALFVSDMTIKDRADQALRLAIAALSSAPATPSPLPDGVDVHEEWQRRLKRNDFSDDDWSEWKACDERQVRDIQTLGHPSGFPFLNAEVRRVRITTTALSASAPAPEERAVPAEAEAKGGRS